MRKHLRTLLESSSLFVFAFMLSVVQLNAQTTVQIGTGTTTTSSTLYSPAYRASSTSTTDFSRSNILFTADEMSAAGITPGAQISKISFNKASNAAFTGTGAKLRFYAANTTNTPPLSTATTWTSILATHTLVYENLAQQIPSATGWMEFVFTAPFVYTGGALEIASEWDFSAATTSTGNSFKWEYTTGTGNYIIGATSSSALPEELDGTSSTYKIRPNIRMTYTAAAGCSGTPVAGTAETSAATVCAGQPFDLSLSGSTVSPGLTYKWQSSTDNATWTDIAGATSLSFTATQTASTHYRAIVTCTSSGVSSTSSTVQVASPALVSGTFTINKAQPTGGTNFQSFNDAYNYIKCGINGPVVFNVVTGSGPYNEQLIMNAVFGTSATNTITFNGNGEEIAFLSTNTDERAVIKLNGTDYVTLNNLVVTATGSASGQYGYAVQLMNDANFNTINNCRINSNTTSTSTGFAGIVVSNSATSAISSTGNLCDDNTFSNNIITGGYYGLTLASSNEEANGNNKIINNIVREFYYYGIYVRGSFNTLIETNTITRPTRVTVSEFNGIYFTGLNTKAKINRNRITNPFGGDPDKTSDFNGIYFSSVDALATLENVVSNNIIYNITGSGDAYGIYNSGSDNVWYYHNTIVLDGSAPSSIATYVTSGFYQTSNAAGIEFKNNIIFISRGGVSTKTAIYFATATSTIVANNNNYFINSTDGVNNIGYLTTPKATLADWQTATGQDANSISSNPLFADISSGNLKPTNASIDNLGAPVGITTDFNNAIRSTTTPDMGAIEFTPGGCDVPPTGGNTTLSKDVVCINSVVNIGLTGHSVGVGQTYQWQTAATAAGPYTDLGNVMTNPDSSIVSSTTLFYRVAITCSGVTSYSVPLQLTVNPAFPGGTYTINKNAPANATNFVSFAAAKDALACGIAGPVVFDVVAGSGPYNEQLVLDSIAGTSSINTITFKGNGNTIKYGSTVSAERAVIKLNATDHVTFENLVIDATGGTYGYGVQLLNNADHNTFRGNTIVSSTTSTSTNFNGIIINASATGTTTTGNTMCDGNVFDNNTVTGGYYGLTLVGSSGFLLENNTITNNTFRDFYNYGLYLYYTTNTLVEGNSISRATRSLVTNFYGIYVNSKTLGMVLSKNKISDPFTSARTSTSYFYGIYFDGADGEAGKENIVTNNIIYNVNGEGDVYGLYNTGSDYVRYYHNTISLDDKQSAHTTSYWTRGFYQSSTATGIEFKNNIITITRTGEGDRHAIYLSATGSQIAADHNNYYVAGDAATTFVGYRSGDRATLSAWQTASSLDANSAAFNPFYTDPENGNLKPRSFELDNKGTNVGVATDIVNAARSASTPDVGAYEFAIPPCVTPPVAGSAIANPSTAICMGAKIRLDLAGYSSGGNQTIQWETATTATGPFTALGTPLSFADTTIEATVTMYYRAAVTCGGNTQYSDPVLVNINPALMAGVYTIDGSMPTAGTNFNSFTDAVATLNCGIGGPITFNVAPGTYTEQIRIRKVPGSSSVNTVTFQSANGTASSVVLTYDATSADSNYVVKLDSANYITFKELSITSINATNSRVVHLANTAKGITILNSILSAPVTTVSGTPRAIIYAEDIKEGGHVIKGNTLYNGTSGIYLSGISSSNRAENIVIEGNTINNALQYGAYTEYTLDLKVLNNTINRTATTTSTATFYGFYGDDSDSAYQVMGNKVNIKDASSAAYGIYLTAATARSTSPGKVMNNKVLAVEGNTGTLYGLYQSGAAYSNTLNNVISINTSGATSYGLYSTGGSNINYNNNSIHSKANSATTNTVAYFNHTASSSGLISIRNNIFSHGGGGTALYVTNANFIYSDYNTIYTSGTSLTQTSATDFQPTLNEWRLSAGWDINSISYKPAFNSDADLQPNPADPHVWAIHGRGVQITGNSSDFNNNPRPTTLTAGVPDMGAYEFVPTSIPPVLTAIPASPVAGTTQTFMFGTDTVAKVTWGASAPTSVNVRRFSGVVPPGLAAGAKYMYFYTDVEATGAANYSIKQFYVDSWHGHISPENHIKLGRTDAAGAWITDVNSTLDTTKNIIGRDGLTALFKFTGLTDGTATPAPPVPPAPVTLTPPDSSNRGTRFWVGYGHHQFMSPGQSNGQEMVLYLSAEQPANVTVRINGTPWVRTYAIPANTVITTDRILKTGFYDARLTKEGLSDRAISIESDVPIVAYAHIYGSASSGATMLLPVGTYGYEYYALTSSQKYSTNTYSWFNVIADRDNTVVEITPASPTKDGRPAGVPFTVTLKRGEVYQVLGAIRSGSEGYDMTGSKIKSIPNSAGKCFPIAVFSGSSRTSISCVADPGTSGDNLIQQNFPFQAWGTRYLTAPTSLEKDATLKMTNVYRVSVKDPNTVVKRNGVVLTGLVNNFYYQYESATADYIEADKPIMMAQFISSSGGCGYTGDGDPEMIYVSPMEQAINKVALYRNNEENIDANFLTLIIPTAGINSLIIDGIGSTGFTHTYAHPNLPGYSVVVQRWTSAKAQVKVQSDSAFTAITYGLGSVESYGYNAGTLVKNLNAVAAITNTFLTTGANSQYTCAKTPFKFSLLVPVQPTALKWRFSEVADLSPAVDVVQNNPVSVGTVVINNRTYYKYVLSQDYKLAKEGTYHVPIEISHPDIEGCNNTMETILTVSVIAAPTADFTTVFAGCEGQTAQLSGTGSTANGALINRWNWTFPDGTTAATQNASKQFATAGTMNVQFRVIADDGCVGDTTKPIVVNPLPIPTLVKDTVVVCPGVAATFTVKSPVTGGVYNWYDASQGGNLVHTGTSFTISNVTTTVVYYLEATEAGCVSASRKKIVAMVMPVLTTPVAVVDSIGTNLIRFRWNAVPNAIGYEVSVNGSATWVTPSSGSAGLTHTVTGLQQLQTVTFRVKALGGCDEVQSLEVSGRTVVDHVFIPNSFSPNGDGLNDVLQVYSHIVKEMQFMVFNQWGEKIHESRDQRRAWDGMYKGKLQPAGVYMYVSRIVLKDGTVIQKKGSINLIR